jgi:hypothetical protein
MISSFGNIAVSGTRFRAIGGTVVEDINGYRHHVFNSSGTLTISGNPKQVYILAQDGGNAPPARLTNRAAAGGQSGEARYLQATAGSGNLSVVVGGASSTSYVVNLSTTLLDTDASKTGGAGGVWNSSSPTAGLAGQNGVLHSEKNTIYNSLTIIPTRSGGSGAGGGYNGVRVSAGLFGGGDGGHQSSTNGGNALANSGAGGGGSSSNRGVYTCTDGSGFFYTCGFFEGARGTDGFGGSGYLVISYALS